MKGWGLVLTIVSVLIIVAAVVLFLIPSPAKAPTGGNNPTASTTPEVTVTSATSGITSPYTLTGHAPGSWYFEATLPVALKDASGNVIAQGPAQAQGDWMTTAQVPFSATLTFAAQPAGSAGTLVIKNDNPSGDPANQKELDIPVTF